MGSQRSPQTASRRRPTYFLGIPTQELHLSDAGVGRIPQWTMVSVVLWQSGLVEAKRNRLHGGSVVLKMNSRRLLVQDLVA